MTSCPGHLNHLALRVPQGFRCRFSLHNQKTQLTHYFVSFRAARSHKHDPLIISARPLSPPVSWSAAVRCLVVFRGVLRYTKALFVVCIAIQEFRSSVAALRDLEELISPHLRYVAFLPVAHTRQRPDAGEHSGVHVPTSPPLEHASVTLYLFDVGFSLLTGRSLLSFNGPFPPPAKYPKS